MILEALVQAMDRRDEVFQVIEDSEDLDEAIRRVGQLLGVGEVAQPGSPRHAGQKIHPRPASGHRFPCRRT